MKPGFGDAWTALDRKYRQTTVDRAVNRWARKMCLDTRLFMQTETFKKWDAKLTEDIIKYRASIGLPVPADSGSDP